jgi:FHA domain/zinc-ribbon domain
MPSVYCTQCGHTNPDGARFCSNCGTQLTEGVPAAMGEAGDSTSTMSLSAIEAAVEAEQGEEPAADHLGVEALPSNTALLVVKRGPNAGSRFLLDHEVITAGRHPESDIFLDDVTVSRRHAEFHLRVGRFTVRDAGSLNGTYANGERIDEVTLSSGDEVQIGKFRLVYLSNATNGVTVTSPEPKRRSRRGWWSRWLR